jgi:adenylate cyclase
VFGAPVPKPDHARRAVASAWAMQAAFRAQAEKSNNPLLTRIGISINSGVVVSGNLGSQVKMEYTVIGDNVNVASRLNGLAGSGEIIISQSCYKAAEDFVEVEVLPPQQLKGKTELTQVYRVSGFHPLLDPTEKEKTT